MALGVSRYRYGAVLRATPCARGNVHNLAKARNPDDSTAGAALAGANLVGVLVSSTAASSTSEATAPWLHRALIPASLGPRWRERVAAAAKRRQPRSVRCRDLVDGFREETRTLYYLAEVRARATFAVKAGSRVMVAPSSEVMRKGERSKVIRNVGIFIYFASRVAESATACFIQIIAILVTSVLETSFLSAIYLYGAHQTVFALAVRCGRSTLGPFNATLISYVFTSHPRSWFPHNFTQNLQPIFFENLPSPLCAVLVSHE